MRARSRGPAGNAVGRGERPRALPATRAPGVGSRAARRVLLRPRGRPPSLRTHWKAVAACGAGPDGGGRLRLGACCAADSPAGPLAASGPRPRADASWRCREQGRGSELTSSRLAQGRTQAGRDPGGPEASGRAARRCALPSLATDPGARAPAKWGRCHDKLGCEFASTDRTWPTAFGLENSTKVKS